MFAVTGHWRMSSRSARTAVTTGTRLSMLLTTTVAPRRRKSSTARGATTGSVRPLASLSCCSYSVAGTACPDRTIRTRWLGQRERREQVVQRGERQDARGPLRVTEQERPALPCRCDGVGQPVGGRLAAVLVCHVVSRCPAWLTASHGRRSGTAATRPGASNRFRYATRYRVLRLGPTRCSVRQ